MIQPTIEEINNKLKKVIDNEITRVEAGNWALDFILNDDNVEIRNIKAWHYLVSVSSIDEMITSNGYLYSIEDIKEWIKESNEL